MANKSDSRTHYFLEIYWTTQSHPNLFNQTSCQDEEEFILQVNPKVVVFTIHNFLSAKLQMLGEKPT